MSTTDKIMQALDGQKGKRIWEKRIGPRSPHLMAATRNRALQGQGPLKPLGRALVAPMRL